MIFEPTAHLINPDTGSLDGHTGSYIKTLLQLEGIYSDTQAFDEACKTHGDTVVYRVEDVRPDTDHGNLIFGTTFMEAGDIGGEFYLTRGHIHGFGNRPETYYGESGRGVMLLESPEGESRILEIAPKVMVFVPPYWIHRSVNIGNEPLVMSFCYPADSGQDYDVIAQTCGMAKRIMKDGMGWKAIDNIRYQPRTAEQIKRIYATGDER
ncbi:MAG: glucose-6-phosphate isomerase family protein [Alphaproteobacteria bacterium]